MHCNGKYLCINLTYSLRLNKLTFVHVLSIEIHYELRSRKALEEDGLGTMQIGPMGLRIVLNGLGNLKHVDIYKLEVNSS